jgi:hypothetical protein
MISTSVIDSAVDLVEKTVPKEDIIGTIYEDKEALKQYLSFHILYGNALLAVDKDTGEATGIMIAYECDEDEARLDFDWTAPSGKSCIFVAQLAAVTSEARDLLAEGFLMAFPERKPTFALRKGKFTPMDAHKISKTLISRRNSNGGR